MKKNWQELLVENAKPEELYKNQLTNRIIGNVGNKNDGKTLIILSSIYGNETASLIAMEEVFQNLSLEKTKIRGLCVGLAGNLMALHLGQPYVDEDLNFMWNHAAIENKKKATLLLHSSNESLELMEILRILKQVEPFDREKFLFVNLNAELEEEMNYVLPNKDILSSYYASKLEIPIIRNMAAVIRDTSIQYFDAYSLPAITIIANRPHFKELIHVIKNHIYKILYQLNIIDKKCYQRQIHVIAERNSNLSMELPKNLEFIHRYKPKINHKFEMDSTISLFQKIKKGTRVAKDIEGPIHASCSGYIMFHKKRQQDGFYILQ